MLQLKFKETRLWNEITEEFINIKEQTICLEHSLVSISKWEQKWHKPFMSNEKMSIEESIDYIRCMTITQNVDENIYYCLTQEHVEKINAYIKDPMTATWFSEDGNSKSHSKEVITSELIYYSMIAYNVPVEFQKWHLNRLLTLLRVCKIKNTPPKKMSKKDIMNRNRTLNAQRRKAFNSNG